MEKTTKVDPIKEYLYNSENFLLLVIVSYSKSFKDTVEKIRVEKKIRPKILRNKLKKIDADPYFINNYVLLFKPFKKVLTFSKDRLRSESVKQSYNNIAKFEKQYNADNEISKLLFNTGLSKGLKRRVKSIILYNDWPRLEDGYFLDSTGFSANLLEFVINKKAPEESYISVKLYSDTPSKNLREAIKLAKQLQKTLPNHRRSRQSHKQNIERDHFYYFSRARGLSHKEANKLLKDISFYPYEDGAVGRKYEKRMQRFLHDIPINN